MARGHDEVGTDVRGGPNFWQVVILRNMRGKDGGCAHSREWARMNRSSHNNYDERGKYHSVGKGSPNTVIKDTFACGAQAPPTV